MRRIIIVALVLLLIVICVYVLILFFKNDTSLGLQEKLSPASSPTPKPSTSPPPPPLPPTFRQTSHGPVEGIEEETVFGQKYYAFRGIPYAAPPITGIDPYTGEKVDRRFKVRLIKCLNVSHKLHQLNYDLHRLLRRHPNHWNIIGLR